MPGWVLAASGTCQAVAGYGRHSNHEGMPCDQKEMVSPGMEAHVQHEAVEVSGVFYYKTDVLRQIRSKYPNYWEEVGWGGRWLYKIKEIQKDPGKLLKWCMQMHLHKE